MNINSSPICPFHDAPDLRNLSQRERLGNLFTDWKTQTNLVILHIEVIPFDPPCFFLSTSFSLL